MDTQKLRFIGRHIIKNGNEYFSFSGTGFEFTLVPQSANCSFEISFESVVNTHEYQYIGIFVDGKEYSRERLSNGHFKVEISLDIKNPVVVKVIKLNETSLSALYLIDISLNNCEFGEVPSCKKKIIGFFGDSITCGYGVLEYQGTQFKTETEDFTKAYPYLACSELGMDYSIVARSGIGISIPIYVDKLFGEIYDTVDMHDKCVFDRKLDYAVINLATNDNGGLFQMFKEEERPRELKILKDRYVDLIDRIIKDNPGVKIVMIYGMIQLTEVMEKALEEIYQYASNHYDNEFRILKGKPNSDGANCHPYWPAQEENAKLLVDLIKEMEH